MNTTLLLQFSSKVKVRRRTQRRNARGTQTISKGRVQVKCSALFSGSWRSRQEEVNAEHTCPSLCLSAPLPTALLPTALLPLCVCVCSSLPTALLLHPALSLCVYICSSPHGPPPSSPPLSLCVTTNKQNSFLFQLPTISLPETHLPL